MLIGPSEGLLEYFVSVIKVATMLRVFPNLWTSKCLSLTLKMKLGVNPFRF